MADDWDLYAVVRSCKSATHNTTTNTSAAGAPTNPITPPSVEEEDPFWDWLKSGRKLTHYSLSLISSSPEPMLSKSCNSFTNPFCPTPPPPTIPALTTPLFLLLFQIPPLFLTLEDLPVVANITYNSNSIIFCQPTPPRALISTLPSPLLVLEDSMANNSRFCYPNQRLKFYPNSSQRSRVL
ncbi:putative WRKY transcription factor 27 [Prunus yedoensis var. nudiflora]|uniref:Putative WRKY transcription factor 27 n=1 Tax=Prunus yedoensis var. nudiflora TaxID=2094558 RepID=A0A314UN25_PRUYE|nr:putative WRKY transcription factor 27 [Prunus yedoensis var. nudiflora]